MKMSLEDRIAYNDALYKKTLVDLLYNHTYIQNSDSKMHGEILGFTALFAYDAHITGTNEKYVKNEIDWYLSQDLNIIGHEGIENNPTWKRCASENGNVNSNYGWCIFSADNSFQYDRALEALCENKNTRQAIMVYTRPEINTECCDGVNARYDMICTCYTSSLIRDNKLLHTVHMRSNDVWYGLRNDLAWQQWVQKKLHGDLLACYPDLELGAINWHADSLHLYKNTVDKVKEYLEKTK